MKYKNPVLKPSIFQEQAEQLLNKAKTTKLSRNEINLLNLCNATLMRNGNEELAKANAQQLKETL